MSGMIIMIRCWAGSMVVGVIFCMTNMDTPISTGVRKSGSFWLRSGIHRKDAPRSSMETVQHAVERDQEGHGQQDGQAAHGHLGAHVHAVAGVELADLLLHLLAAWGRAAGTFR